MLVDGAVHPEPHRRPLAINLQAAGSVVNVGLPYTATIKTMPIEAGAQDGTAQASRWRSTTSSSRCTRLAGRGTGRTDSNMDEYAHAWVDTDMDEPVPCSPGDTGSVGLAGEYERGPQMVIQHRLPLPCTVEGADAAACTYDR